MIHQEQKKDGWDCWSLKPEKRFNLHQTLFQAMEYRLPLPYKSQYKHIKMLTHYMEAHLQLHLKITTIHYLAIPLLSHIKVATETLYLQI